MNGWVTNRVDGRLVGWADVMPTLLDLAGVDIPETVEGISMVGEGETGLVLRRGW